MTENIKVQNDTRPTVVRVQAYSLAEALQKAQTGVQQGYTIDLESNEGYPQQFGSMITFTLLKATVGAIREVLEVSAEVKANVLELVVPAVLPTGTKYKRKEK